MLIQQFKLRHRKLVPFKNDIKTNPNAFADEFLNAFKMENRRIRITLINGYWLSTIFLVLDHGMGDTPELFETAYWRDTEEREVIILGRCATHRQALKMHLHYKQLVKDGKINEA